MSQCGLLIRGMTMYEEIYQCIPSEDQLIEYMARNNLSPDTIEGWLFDLPEADFFARKNGVITESGKKMDIIIKKNKQFEIFSNYSGL